MASSNKYRDSYELVKRVYIFGFVFMFMVFGFSLFKAKGIDKLTPAIFLTISIIAALYTIIKNPYRKVFSKPSNNPDHFLKINIEALRAGLACWYEPYKKVIEKVVLYSNSNQANMPISVEYILYFDLKNNPKTKSTQKIFKEFVYNEQQPIINSKEFKNIYKKPSPNNHINEWYLTTEKPEGVNEKFSFVLFP